MVDLKASVLFRAVSGVGPGASKYRKSDAIASPTSRVLASSTLVSAPKLNDDETRLFFRMASGFVLANQFGEDFSKLSNQAFLEKMKIFTNFDHYLGVELGRLQGQEVLAIDTSDKFSSLQFQQQAAIKIAGKLLPRVRKIAAEFNDGFDAKWLAIHEAYRTINIETRLSRRLEKNDSIHPTEQALYFDVLSLSESDPAAHTLQWGDSKTFSLIKETAQKIVKVISEDWKEDMQNSSNGIIAAIFAAQGAAAHFALKVARSFGVNFDNADKRDCSTVTTFAVRMQRAIALQAILQIENNTGISFLRSGHPLCDESIRQRCTKIPPSNRLAETAAKLFELVTPMVEYKEALLCQQNQDIFAGILPRVRESLPSAPAYQLLLPRCDFTYAYRDTLSGRWIAYEYTMKPRLETVGVFSGLSQMNASDANNSDTLNDNIKDDAWFYVLPNGDVRRDIHCLNMTQSETTVISDTTANAISEIRQAFLAKFNLLWTELYTTITASGGMRGLCIFENGLDMYLVVPTEDQAKIENSDVFDCILVDKQSNFPEFGLEHTVFYKLVSHEVSAPAIPDTQEPKQANRRASSLKALLHLMQTVPITYEKVMHVLASTFDVTHRETLGRSSHPILERPTENGTASYTMATQMPKSAPYLKLFLDDILEKLNVDRESFVANYAAEFGTVPQKSSLLKRMQ